MAAGAFAALTTHLVFVFFYFVCVRHFWVVVVVVVVILVFFPSSPKEKSKTFRTNSSSFLHRSFSVGKESLERFRDCAP
jgi:heme/copper-type cytochrome/quinol oxidase subunit 2